MTTVRSRVTEPVLGLTADKEYEVVFLVFLNFWRSYVTLTNDHGKMISIRDPDKYLHIEDLADAPAGPQGVW